MTEQTVATTQTGGTKQLAAIIRERTMPLLPQLLPPSMSPERFLAVTVQAIARQPSLATCQPASVVMAVLEAAQLGLEPTGAVGGAWLVPMREGKGGLRVARLILDYRGLLQLLREAGAGEIKAVLVYDGDEFAVEEGTHPKIVHRPAYRTSDPAAIKFAYAWCLDQPEKFEVMTRAEIDRIRARSRAANEGPWVTDYGQMARKTVIKRLAQYLPLRPAARLAIVADTAREFGEPGSETPSFPDWRELAERSAPPKIEFVAPPPEPEVEAPATDTPAEDTIAEEPEVVAACGAESPYGDGAICSLDAGHSGLHRSESATW
jgi:recombination protein RecT